MVPPHTAALRAKELFKEVLDGDETVADLTDEFQINRIMQVWRQAHGHAAATISRNMSVLSAAIFHSRVKDAPKIIHDKKTVAKKLRIPPPESGKWFPKKDDELARSVDGINSEHTFRWMMIALNTACRPEAALDLSPGQVDLEHDLVDLNPKGRMQEATKYRPIIRMTECLRGWTEEWDARLMGVKSEEERVEIESTQPWKLTPRFVPYRSVDSLQSTFNRVRMKASVDMPQMVPYSIRNKMVTVLRIHQVPGSQRSQWLGHVDVEEQRTTSQSYGEFDPSYLLDAANATDEFLWELNKRTDRDLFVSSQCKFSAKSSVVRLSYKKKI